MEIITKKIKDSECQQYVGGGVHTLLADYKPVQPIWETVQSSLAKMRNRTPSCPETYY